LGVNPAFDDCSDDLGNPQPGPSTPRIISEDTSDHGPEVAAPTSVTREMIFLSADSDSDDSTASVNLDNAGPSSAGPDVVADFPFTILPHTDRPVKGFRGGCFSPL